VIEQLAVTVALAAGPDPLETALAYRTHLATVVAEQEELAAQRAADAARTTRSTERVAPAGTLPALLLTIRDHESSGDYSAYNADGCEGYGCGGAYQLHAGYASTWAAEAGYPGMPGNAALWPPATQDAVALYKFNATGGALWCDWTDYC